MIRSLKIVFVLLVAVSAAGCASGPFHRDLTKTEQVDVVEYPSVDVPKDGSIVIVAPIKVEEEKIVGAQCELRTATEIYPVKEYRYVDGQIEERDTSKRIRFSVRKAVCPDATTTARSRYQQQVGPFGLSSEVICNAFGPFRTLSAPKELGC